MQCSLAEVLIKFLSACICFSVSGPVCFTSVSCSHVDTFAMSGPESLRVSIFIKQQRNKRKYEEIQTIVALLISKKREPKCHTLLNSSVTVMWYKIQSAKYTLSTATDCTGFGKYLSWNLCSWRLFQGMPAYCPCNGKNYRWSHNLFFFVQVVCKRRNQKLL